MVKLPTEAEPVVVLEGDALEWLPRIPDASVDCVVTDPPYPFIKREYGVWDESSWFALMDPVVEHCRRVLKPTGSAVFVVQPNSERVGKMRTWWLRFMLQWAERWGMVQDAWWWNTSSMPLGGACRDGLMRGSVKPCAWFGGEDCYRDQSAVLMTEASHTRNQRAAERFDRENEPSRTRSATEGPRDCGKRLLTRCVERGGTTPFNVFPVGSDARWSGGTHGHGASTPMLLVRWWTRYICPPGGIVLDPFLGSGTAALAAMKEGRRCVGIERMPKYAEIARRRVAEATQDAGLFAGSS